ncbi:H-X9-DG-CTERM domain-containing protein [Leifsonia xyli]|uniref:H-X9-DG-CTERM domain-containing protein n=1 Tax=Leifsonia xyli TaxID=1575 RepID=UPI003D66E5E9
MGGAAGPVAAARGARGERRAQHPGRAPALLVDGHVRGHPRLGGVGQLLHAGPQRAGGRHARQGRRRRFQPRARVPEHGAPLGGAARAVSDARLRGRGGVGPPPRRRRHPHPARGPARVADGAHPHPRLTPIPPADSSRMVVMCDPKRPFVTNVEEEGGGSRQEVGRSQGAANGK